MKTTTTAPTPWAGLPRAPTAPPPAKPHGTCPRAWAGRLMSAVTRANAHTVAEAWLALKHHICRRDAPTRIVFVTRLPLLL